MFARNLVASWGDMDFNAHMADTAYLDKSADLRMMFFAENGFPMSEFVRLRVGPVVQKDEIEYQREVNLLDTLRGTLALAGLAPDGSRWLMRNEFFRSDDKLAARVTSAGGWLDLAARRLVAAPSALLVVLTSLTRTADFAALPSSMK
ncbi:MAG TPA: thioesterase family protein [Burkholderiaceae bacterium]|nr:thioesterase family protein [Burkholderiaceae bacterium]